jgi:hypothetical protein
MELSDEEFRRLCGYKKETMLTMAEILREAYESKHKRRGRHSKLDVGDMLMLSCKYWREYVTYFSLANEYGVAESTAHDITVWVENVLIRSGKFGLPGKKKLIMDESLEVIVVDVTESPVERPKKRQKRWYSGKKKRHTIKIQIVICAKSKQVIAIFISRGRNHDFKMWKESVGAKVLKHIKIQGDSGYQGIAKLHANSETPKKKSKKKPLAKDDRANNRRIGSERVIVEHVNRRLKRLRIVAERYRNRRKRFVLRVSLFCGIHNFELANN